MSSSFFQVIEHIIPCQHIREYHRGTGRGQEGALQLAVKQYKPLNNSEPDGNAVTIIGAHANGIPKEVYEPLWDEMLKLSEQHAFRIRGIWIADMSNQGTSGILNEQVQGDDPSYFDHSRDLLHMVNTFRSQMPRPIIGIGHSIGAAELVALSTMHPHLFTTLILIEPMIQREVPPGPNAAMGSTHRRDLWPSYTAAEDTFRKSKFFARWDSRTLDKVIKYSLRPVPTAVYPLSSTAPTGAHTLVTTKHQEVWSFLRPNFEPMLPPSRESQAAKLQEKLLAPDIDPTQPEAAYLFYRPELRISYSYLPFLRPSVLYLFGAKSPMSSMKHQAEKMNTTGIGLGGSGGITYGQVEKHVFHNRGHMLPCEDVDGCAGKVAEWIGTKLKQFRENEHFLDEHPSAKSENMLTVSKKWMELVRLPGTALRPVMKEKL